MSTTNLKDALKARALELGFADCRVVAAQAPPHHEAFDAWLADGNFGEMHWMARNKERRLDLQQVLPGARSLLVLAMNYFQGQAQLTPGRIARYAWGDDYHELMLGRLKSLELLLAEAGGVQKCYVDTGPILERDYAALAGIGWQGKSTMLLNQQLGTWFFLGEILTTLELPADSPQANRCGSCTRCINACPTGAITEPYRLDARRCISYLTIELKGSIPEPLRPLIGDRIYGCDDCLEVCPWNRFAQVSRESAFAAPEPPLELPEYLALDEHGFRALFNNSPIKRIKRRGFLRNVCVVLGNIGTPQDLPALERAASDSEPLIVEHALWAIEQIRQRHGSSGSA